MTRQGIRIATSVDGALTGEGGDIIVIDDPHNVREAESNTVRQGVLEWWDQSMHRQDLTIQRMVHFVIIMQRVHENDLTGHILANEYEDWITYALPQDMGMTIRHLSSLLWHLKIRDRKMASYFGQIALMREH